MSDDLSTATITGWYGEDDCPTCQRWREIRESLAAGIRSQGEPERTD